MKKVIVISQPMYFPWVGLLEQIRLSDVFIHYDDVQFSRGYFNRVQVKTKNALKWLTIPIKRHPRSARINEIEVDDNQSWKSKHLSILKQEYSSAPYCHEMLALVDELFSRPLTTLSEISRESTMLLAHYFGLAEKKKFICSSELGIAGASSLRLRDLCLAVGGKIYVTGHGARNYLDHELFEQSGISVQYMQYKSLAYPQLHGPFTPYVTALDLVANCGRSGRSVIVSQAMDWKEFINDPQ